MNILGLEFFTLLVLLKFTFFRFSNNRDALFSFSLFGHGVFIVAGLLHNVEISMGFAFGLFAVFSMLRYRTESLSVRNMTYLFLVIVISLVSSVGPVSLVELVVINSMICAITALCETKFLAERFETSTLTYGRMKMLKPQFHGHLLADLVDLTGLNVQKVEVVDRNYKAKTAKLDLLQRQIQLTLSDISTLETSGV